MFGPEQKIKAGDESFNLQIGEDNNAPIIINDPLAKEALATLQKQLDNAQISLEEKNQLIKSQQEVILNLSNAKQSHSLPEKSVNDALEEIIKTGDTEKAKALLTQQIDANTEKVKKYQEEIKAQAKLYFQRGALAFMTDTHAALADFTETAKLDPNNASAWNQTGYLHQRLGQLDEALNAYAQVKQLGESQDDKEAIAVSIGNMGVVYKTRGELDKALEMYQQSLAIEKALGRKEGMASDYTNMGVVFATSGDLNKARKLWQQSLQLFTDIGAKPQMELVQSWFDELDQQGSN